MESPESTNLDRRAFLALVGSSLIGGLAAGGCSTRPVAARAAPDPRLAALVEVLLPRTATPGGLDSDVPGFVARMLGGALPTRAREALDAGFEALDEACLATRGEPFARLPRTERSRLAGWIDAAAFDPADREGASLRAFWLTLKQLVVVGHFSSRAVVDGALLYDPLPGSWEADIARTAESRVSYIDRTGVPYLLAIPL